MDHAGEAYPSDVAQIRLTPIASVSMSIPMVITRPFKAGFMAHRSSVALALIASSLTLASPARAQELAFSRAAEDAAARVAESFPILQGSVVGIEGDRLLIDLGAKQKVYQGMELQVYREGDEVKHPVTGQVLGRRDKRLGLLRVVEVKEGFSEAVIVSRQEGSTITAGDLVRVSSDRLSVALPLIDAGEVKGRMSIRLRRTLRSHWRGPVALSSSRTIS